jgi:hypothetical protein
MALTGVLFFVLLVVSGVIADNSLDDRASGTAVLDWFKTHHAAAELSSGLIAVIIVVGLLFYSALRDHLAPDDEDEAIARVGFAGAIIFAVAGATSSGLIYTTAHAVNSLDGASAKSLYVAQYATGMLAGAGMAALGLAMGVLIIRTGRLPRWIGWFAIVAAVVALVPPINMIAFFGTGLWTLAASIAMYLRIGGGVDVRVTQPVTVPA